MKKYVLVQNDTFEESHECWFLTLEELRQDYYRLEKEYFLERVNDLVADKEFDEIKRLCDILTNIKTLSIEQLKDYYLTQYNYEIYDSLKDLSYSIGNYDKKIKNSKHNIIITERLIEDLKELEEV